MKIAYAIALLFVWMTSFGQIRPLPPIIKKLYGFKGNAITVPHTFNFLVPIDDLTDVVTSNQGQFVVKKGDSIYVFTTNTGRIYLLQPAGDRFGWLRLDSTYFTGYNARSLFFGLGDDFYSFGGEGFWYTNGDLRIYNKKSHEWDAVKVSEPITRVFPFNHNLGEPYFIDTVAKKLILKGPDLHPEYLIDKKKEVPYKDKLYSLDLQTGIWAELGKYNPPQFLEDIFCFTSTGIFGRGHFYDFKANKVFKYGPNVESQINSLWNWRTHKGKIDLSFWADSVIYFGSYAGAIDSIRVSSSDLIDTGTTVYASTPKAGFPVIEKMGSWLMGLMIVSALVLPFIFYSRKKSIRPSEQPVQFRSARIVDLLDERERSLLQFIFSRSLQQRLTSIEEINKEIGVANRSVEIQKRMRSDLLISINEKLALIDNDKNPVVDKQRSEFDKRSFEYFIRPEKLHIVKNLLENKAED